MRTSAPSCRSAVPIRSHEFIAEYRRSRCRFRAYCEVFVRRSEGRMKNYEMSLNKQLISLQDYSQKSECVSVMAIYAFDKYRAGWLSRNKHPSRNWDDAFVWHQGQLLGSAWNASYLGCHLFESATSAQVCRLHGNIFGASPTSAFSLYYNIFQRPFLYTSFHRSSQPGIPSPGSPSGAWCLRVGCPGTCSYIERHITS